MGAQIGMGNPAWHLTRMLFNAAEEGKHRHRIIAGLDLQHRIVNGAAVQTRRSAGLESTHWQLQFAQTFGQRDRGRVAKTSSAKVFQPNVDQSIEEGTGSQYHRRGLKTDAELSGHAGHPTADHRNVIDGLLEQGQAWLVFQPDANRLLV